MTISKPNPKILFPDLSYQVMQAVYEVHNQIGPGFSEEIYENALVCEFNLRQIPFECQKVIKVEYKNQFVGNYRLDLLVEEKIILELKAVATLQDVFKAQVLSYLRATGLKLGVVINFGSQRVQYARVVNGQAN